MVRRGSMVLLVAVALLLSGCSSGESTKTLTVEERFAQAKALFDRGSYLDAINEFTDSSSDELAVPPFVWGSRIGERLSR